MIGTVHVVEATADAERRRSVVDVLAQAGADLGTAGPDRLTVVVGGAELVRAAAMAGPQAIVVVADAPDRRSATLLIDAGAAGIVPADATRHALVPALELVRAGLVVVPGEARQAVRRPTLTVRQQQIAGLMVLGLGNAQIGERLFLTESTVKTHVRAILAALGVGSRKEAVALVLDPGSGVGRGILAFGPALSGREAYRRPRVS